MVNNIPTPPPPIVVVWYQAPAQIATAPEKLPFYDAVLAKVKNRVDAFPGLQLDYVYDKISDTINLAGEVMLFNGLEQDLFNAGFRPKDIPNQGMDPEERIAFREMILRGGTLNG